MSKWEAELAPRVQKLQDADKQLLAGYLARAKMSEAFGGPGMPPGTTVGNAIDNQKAFLAAQATEVAAQKAATKMLKLSLGRPRMDYNWYTLPVMVENTSDNSFGYVEVTCRFISASGQLLATDMTNWTSIDPRATVSGEITSNAFSAVEVAKTDCSVEAQ